jgi:hypothetical protein
MYKRHFLPVILKRKSRQTFSMSRGPIWGQTDLAASTSFLRANFTSPQDSELKYHVASERSPHSGQHPCFELRSPLLKRRNKGDRSRSGARRQTGLRLIGSHSLQCQDIKQDIQLFPQGFQVTFLCATLLLTRLLQSHTVAISFLGSLSALCPISLGTFVPNSRRISSQLWPSQMNNYILFIVVFAQQLTKTARVSSSSECDELTFGVHSFPATTFCFLRGKKGPPPSLADHRDFSLTLVS